MINEIKYGILVGNDDRIIYGKQYEIQELINECKRQKVWCISFELYTPKTEESLEKLTIQISYNK